MKDFTRYLLLLFLACAMCVCERTYAAEDNPRAVVDLLNRIGGKGAGKKIFTRLDERLQRNGQEVFRISTYKGRPMVEGSSLSAITTGINWYLNHVAHINLTWNRPTTRFGKLPLPTETIERSCDAEYRYYLNYCTFGYSMTTWTWERWQQEIDWMALHGINMPLQIVGLEQVWRAFLMEDCGYSEADAEAFVPGPAYTAWWGMNNLQGWGGDTPSGFGVTNDAWYERQTRLARQIVERERELGIRPVLPGFSGMVPSNFQEKTGISVDRAGSWCQFQRPYILDPTSPQFATKAAQYYRQLERVMGTSPYYSMDPFHEGGTIQSGNYEAAYKAIFEAMNNNCGQGSQWVIQQWQWAPHQALSLQAVPAGRLIVLDLFSDGNPAFDSYQGYDPQHAIYCTIPNFGGRTGFFGRIPKMANNYFTYKHRYPSIRGVGAAPEAIEQTPVVYDLLFELPWMGSEPDCEAWIADYATSRYGLVDADAQRAWQLMLRSALNNTTTLQGPHEATLCARPSLHVDRVSAWGGTHIFYDQQTLVDAAFALLRAGERVGGANYSYDLADLTRQVLTDYSSTLLSSLNIYRTYPQSEDFVARRDSFLQLILDVDRLLGTNSNFRLGKWTAEARAAAREVRGWTSATQDWYELANARTLLTTWGDEATSERAPLHDYSYREWQGLLRDFYYVRWKSWFDHQMSAPQAGWFYHDWAWSHRLSWQWDDATKSTTPLKSGEPGYRYSEKPEGDTRKIASELLQRYFPHHSR